MLKRNFKCNYIFDGTNSFEKFIDSINDGKGNYILKKIENLSVERKRVNRMITYLAYLKPQKIIKGIRYIGRLIDSAYYKRKFQAGDNFYVYSFRNAKGMKNIKIGRNFNAGKQLRLEAWEKYQDKTYNPEIIIGNNVMLGDDNHIGAINRITIGDYLLTGSNVYITDHNHGKSNESDCMIPPVQRKLVSCGEVRIGNNVWLGNNVVVMDGVKIGDGVVIGANSVVTRDIPDYCVAVGSPAKVIRDNRKMV